MSKCWVGPLLQVASSVPQGWEPNLSYLLSALAGAMKPPKLGICSFCSQGLITLMSACVGRSAAAQPEKATWKCCSGSASRALLLSRKNPQIQVWLEAAGASHLIVHLPWCTEAAAGGHLAVLQWAREQGCHWGYSTCAAAAGGGHLAVLQWAWEQGCPMDEGTCSAAAGNGHLEVLRWARHHGCA